MSRDLPAKPNLEHLKKQAKSLLSDYLQGDATAVARFGSIAHPKLADARQVLARDYGFATWAKLKEHVDALATASNPAEALKAAVLANDAVRVGEVLARYPELKSKLNDPMPNCGFGETPLFGAVQRSNREMIEILLRAGADINARTHWWAGSFGVLDDAARQDRPRWLAPFLIERGATVDVHAAAHLGMLEKLDELISASPDLVHTRGGDGQTALHFAPTVEIAQYLLDRGADIDARDIDHESTAAQYMVRDRQDVARHLVAQGCRTDILMAAALGDLALVRKHADSDPASIRMSVSDEYFPKQDPHSGGTIYIWTLGAHKTAHLIGREFGHEAIFRLLMDRSPNELELALACEIGDEASFKALLAMHPNLAQTLSNEDRRKVAYAAQSNNTEAVRLMLEAGWPADVRGQHGATALHWAAFHGNAGMAREILRYQPPLEVCDDDNDGRPLGWALYGSMHGWHRGTGDYAGTVEALLNAGAKAPEWTEDLEASEAVRAVLMRFAEG